MVETEHFGKCVGISFVRDQRCSILLDTKTRALSSPGEDDRTVDLDVVA